MDTDQSVHIRSVLQEIVARRLKREIVEDIELRSETRRVKVAMMQELSAKTKKRQVDEAILSRSRSREHKKQVNLEFIARQRKRAVVTALQTEFQARELKKQVQADLIARNRMHSLKRASVMEMNQRHLRKIVIEEMARRTKKLEIIQQLCDPTRKLKRCVSDVDFSQEVEEETRSRSASYNDIYEHQKQNTQPSFLGNVMNSVSSSLNSVFNYLSTPADVAPKTEKKEEHTTLRISNLPKSADVAWLKEQFGVFGELRKTKIVRHGGSCFALVSFVNRTESEKAVNHFRQDKLHVAFYDRTDKKSPEESIVAEKKTQTPKQTKQAKAVNATTKTAPAKSSPAKNSPKKLAQEKTTPKKPENKAEKSKKPVTPSDKRTLSPQKREKNSDTVRQVAHGRPLFTQNPFASLAPSAIVARQPNGPDGSKGFSFSS